MKKITTMFLMGIFFVAIVGAASYSFQISKVVIEPKENVTITPDTITYKCDGETKYEEKYEKNWDSNDIRSLTSQNCSGTITDIQKGSDYWEKNIYGLESFNQDVLKADECAKSGTNFTAYDSKTSGCVEPKVEEDLGEEI